MQRKHASKIDKDDMANAVQESLARADSAVQPSSLVSKADLIEGKIPVSQLPYVPGGGGDYTDLLLSLDPGDLVTYLQAKWEA